MLTDNKMMQRRVADLDPTKVNSTDSKYSVQALTAMAEVSSLLSYVYIDNQAN